LLEAEVVERDRRREARRLRLLGGVIVLGFLTWTGAAIFAVGGTPESTGVDSYSRAAVGHHAFVALLESLGVAVRRSRFRTADAARPGELIVFAEPTADEEFDGSDPYSGAGVRLFVLPKRAPAGARGEFVSEETANEVLRRLDPGASLVRTPDGAVEGRGVSWRPPDVLQTVAPGALVAEWTVPEGAILLRLPKATGDWWVLAEPDLIATHGLAVPGVPSAVVGLVRAAMPEGLRGVVIDETRHGFTLAPSFWTRFSSPPLLFVLLHAALCAALAAWAGAVRFGPPEPEDDPPPEGRAGLVRLTAELLAAAPHGAATVVGRHADLRLRDAASRAGLDPRRPRSELAAALETASGSSTPRGAAAAWREVADRLEPNGGRRLPDSAVVAAAVQTATAGSSSHVVGRRPPAR
jgi:hypothetical protein